MAKLPTVQIEVLDLTKTYKTACGYPVKELIAEIEVFRGKLVVTYEGQFFGSEKIWFGRHWDSDGGEENPAMCLVLAEEETNEKEQ